MSVPARRLPQVPEPLDGGVDRVQRAPSPPPRTAARPIATGGLRRRRRHRLGFAVLAGVLVAPMLIGIVSLNALLAQTSFRIDEAERRIEELSREHLSLVHEQARLSAPGRIAAWARRNGMRLPDDIRSLHASGGTLVAPAGEADAVQATRGEA